MEFIIFGPNIKCFEENNRIECFQFLLFQKRRIEKCIPCWNLVVLEHNSIARCWKQHHKIVCLSTTTTLYTRYHYYYIGILYSIVPHFSVADEICRRLADLCAPDLIYSIHIYLSVYEYTRTAANIICNHNKIEYIHPDIYASEMKYSWCPFYLKKRLYSQYLY